ncbi:hypothetical protein P7C70_g6708, partial [Phenoliferia sp. Uapishka_3]
MKLRSTAWYPSANPLTIKALPPELLHRILDLIRGPTSSQFTNQPITNQDLLSACLVCHQWRTVSQRLLSHDARIHLSVNKICSTLASPQFTTRHLWLHIDLPIDDIVWMHPAVVARWQLAPSETVWTHQFFSQLPPGLRTLTITNPEGHTPNLAFDLFRSPALKSAKKCLHCSSKKGADSSSFFTGLTVLSIQNPECLSDPGDLEQPLSFRLVDLSLSLNGVFPSYGQPLLKALLAASLPTLRFLRVTMTTVKKVDLDFFTRKFSPVARGVEELSINFDYNHDQSIFDLRDFISLERLELVFYPSRLRNTSPLVILDPLLSSLPSPTATLTTVAVGISANDLDTLAATIDHSALVNLSRLELLKSNAGSIEEIEAGRSLMEACEERGIRIAFGE